MDFYNVLAPDCGLCGLYEPGKRLNAYNQRLIRIGGLTITNRLVCSNFSNAISAKRG